MATSVLLPLIDALIDRLGAALSVNVLDAYGNIDDPGDFLMVGAEDPDADRAVGAEGKQEWAGLGARSRYEEGTVTCVALSWNGDADLRAARARCKAIQDAVENHLRSDPNLGGTVPGLTWTGYGTDHRYTPIQAEDGAAVMCVFDVAFKARI